LHVFDKDSLLPDRGILFFFYKDPEFDQRGSILKPKQVDAEESERFLGTGRCKVLYSENVNELKRSTPPKDLPSCDLEMANKYRACRMRFRTERTLPVEPYSVLGKDGKTVRQFVSDSVEFSWSDAVQWYDYIADIRGDLLVTQVLGYADMVHSTRSGLHWFENFKNFRTFSEAQQLAAEQDVHLLLQLSDDIGLFTDIPISDNICFFIRETDLRNRDFSHVWWDR
jgi:uncharacterized protein YwqG